MRILVTGGAGYIGSHTCVKLIEQGYEVAIYDDLSNSKPETVDRIERITGIRPLFFKADILDRKALDDAFEQFRPDAVIHFAGKKAVGESVAKPLMYYHNNITGTLQLLQSMKDHGCKKIAFSSSATVYGTPETVPVSEDFPLSYTNPYGGTKLMIEYMLKDLYVSDSEWAIVILRYFNPIGAHESGLLGDDPNGIPNNLMPYITRVAKGILPELKVFGNDYDTHDGTGVRDYIHVLDLAQGHIDAINHMSEPGVQIYNLGTGTGYSVLDLVKAFEKATGIHIPYKITDRRPGDVAVNYADPAKAERCIGFKATHTLEDMCRSAWNFERNNQCQ